VNILSWAFAVVQSEDADRVGSHKFITCMPKEVVVTSNFLCFYYLGREGLKKIEEASPGGAGRNRTLGFEKVGKI